MRYATTFFSGKKYKNRDCQFFSIAHLSDMLVRLEVENFKSYYGFQTLGPFLPFTAVIGPNGAGMGCGFRLILQRGAF